MAGPEPPRSSGRRPRAGTLLRAQIGYQLRVLVRAPLSAFATLVVPLMVLLAVNLLYKGTHLQSRGGIAYAQFFTPAMVAFALVNACYASVISNVTLARDEGILKRIRSTPLPPWIYMAGRIASAGIVALVSAVVVVAVGAAVYDFQIVWDAVPAALVVLAMAVFCFCAVALAVTVLVPRADAAFPVAWGTILALCFVSDVFMPVDDAPRWLRDVASLFPLRPVADDLESAFNPVQGSHALHLGHLGVLAAWGVAASAFALVAFRWEPSGGRETRRRTRRRAAFGLDRARALFAERAEVAGGEPRRPRRPIPREHVPPNAARPPGAARAPGRPQGVERLEGPAPWADSSVPPEAEPPGEPRPAQRPPVAPPA